MGQAIYQPKGKASEYSEWACNFYVGCSNGCTYCYCKKGILAGVIGQDKPQLKKCFRDESHALEVFEKELLVNLPELQKHGLFFSFTTDPMLDVTMDLTLFAVKICVENGVPVKILTKNSENTLFPFIGACGTEFIGGVMQNFFQEHRRLISIGFTLTGHDELEPGASTNQERIEAMKKLHDAGFKTFASIEPIIDFSASFQMICDTNCICDLYKIGLESGKKYDAKELIQFMKAVVNQIAFSGPKIYFKDSLLKTAGINRDDLPSNCVNRDFNIFNQ